VTKREWQCTADKLWPLTFFFLFNSAGKRQLTEAVCCYKHSQVFHCEHAKEKKCNSLWEYCFLGFHYFFTDELWINANSVFGNRTLSSVEMFEDCNPSRWNKWDVQGQHLLSNCTNMISFAMVLPKEEYSPSLA